MNTTGHVTNLVKFPMSKVIFIMILIFWGLVMGFWRVQFDYLEVMNHQRVKEIP